MRRERSLSPSSRKERGSRRHGLGSLSPPPAPRNYDKRRYSPSWGDERADGEDGDRNKGKGKEKERARTNYQPSGILTTSTLPKGGVPLKYNEPADAAKPTQRWRLHVFKGDTQVGVIRLGERSCYRFGRDPSVSDVLIEHESCSKQHAAIQHRQVTIDHGYGNYATSNRPYLIDLESTHGTFLNGKKIEPSRFIQLLPKDVIRFAANERQQRYTTREMSTAQQQRIPVFPTRMALNNMKIKLKGAQKGHSLLKRKSDALTSRFRQILQRIREAKLLMGKTMRQAAFALAEVNFAAGDISYAVRERVTSAQLKVRARLENVSGVQLPTFECATEGSAGSTLPTSSTSAAGPNSSSSPPPSTEGATQWLGRGGQQVQKCREAFIKALQSLVELAGLQTAFFVLDETIRITNRRVNALEYVVLPKVENTLAYIISELDEQDREDFFRLKKVQSNKKKHGEREQASRKAMENEGKADGDGSLLPFLGRLQISDRDATGGEFDEGPRSILADLEDADVFI